MPSIQRPLSGDVMVFQLHEERERTADPATIQKHGRSARTLLKDGPLRVTLVVLGPGGELAEHSADGPITVQPLDGSIRFTIGGQSHDVAAGEMLSAGAGLPHTVQSEAGAAFLLTVALEAGAQGGSGRGGQQAAKADD
ncbi:MAG: cupin domain-containing protein [Gemmatimonadetes bacterium]|nr:cupin domain-containing protein [Gemmatimonadota bacterium]